MMEAAAITCHRKEKGMTGRQAKLLAAGAIGNALEFYDFLIFGYLSLQIGLAFFPTGDRVAAILASLAAFAVGMVMRPLGGLMLGLMADRGTRRNALVVSAAMIAVPTFLIGILPSYEQIGVLAPVLLVALRVIQGLSLGGEFPSSLVYLVENAPPNRRALFGSFVMSGAMLGMLLGTASCYITADLLGAEAMNAWGWRLPFLASGLLTIVAILLRRAILQDEPAVARSAPPPLVSLLRGGLPNLAGVFFANVVTGTTSFVVFMFIVPWLMQTAGMSYDAALALNLQTLFILLLVMPMAGMLADRIGYRRTALMGVASLILGAHPLLAFMASGNPLLDTIGEAGLACAFAMLVAPMGPLMCGAFPAHVRVTGIALAHGSAVGIVGGLAPMVVQYLMREAHDMMAPAHVVIATGLISGISLLLAKHWQARPDMLMATAAGGRKDKLPLVRKNHPQEAES